MRRVGHTIQPIPDTRGSLDDSTHHDSIQYVRIRDVIGLLNIGGAVAIFTLLQYLWLGTFSRNVHVHRALIGSCAFTAIYLFATAQFLGADNLESASHALHWQTLGALGYLGGVFWLVTSLAGLESQRYAKIITNSAVAVLAVLSLYSLTRPFGILLDAIEIQGVSQGLLGTVTHYTYTGSKMATTIMAASTLGIAWILWCGTCIYKAGRKPIAALLFSFAAVLAIPLLGTLLFHLAVIEFKIPSGISPFYLLVIISILFANEQRELLTELHQQTDQLEEEVNRRTQAEERAIALAHTDEFTGLPNQFHLRERMQERINSGDTNIILILIHINQLRKFRQTFGETNTERILLEFTDRFKSIARYQTLGARISESNFALLTVQPEQLAIDRDRGNIEWQGPHELKRPFLIGFQAYELTYSIGVTHLLPNDTVQDAMQRADLALEAAQNSGDKYGFVYFNKDLAEAKAKERVLENDLREAIEHGELLLHYQPQVDDELRFTGAEALLRWRHPEHGLLAPTHFIPLAERSGMMTRIGQWVIEACCDQLKQWQATESGFEGRLSLNVSPWQLQPEDFSDTVLAILADKGISANNLSFELTESALVDDISRTREHLQRLRDAGIHISLDDFGTGFSSLSYLSELPLDTMKIDKSFVDKFDTPRGRSLLRSMIDIGNSLGLRVVIEGVETDAQFQALKSLSAKQFQGFLFAKPLSPRDFVNWLQEHSSAKA